MTRQRRTRIVCISDTHNCTVDLPKGDVLIHAGDLTNQGSFSELSRAARWLEAADFEAKIVVAGNHDITLDSDFYEEHANLFHNQVAQSPKACLDLFTASPSITYLYHDSATIRLTAPDGPRTEFTDIVIHTPPRLHCDETYAHGSGGCEALRRALWHVRPKLSVCSHLHNGRGAERVTWELDGVSHFFAEKRVDRWTDPGLGNNRLSLVDLTDKHARPLTNDGSDLSRPALTAAAFEPEPAGTASSAGSRPRESLFASSRYTFDLSAVGAPTNDSNSIGRRGEPTSPRADREALLGRKGRRETCVVNAAIMRSKYPHVGGKQFNKPIVVDVDLPVWDG